MADIRQGGLKEDIRHVLIARDLIITCDVHITFFAKILGGMK